MEWTRRAFVGSGMMGVGTVGIPAVSAASASDQPSSPSNAARIDVHQHLLIPEFLAALARHGVTERWVPKTAWSVEGALATMDEHQAAIVQQRPDRFGMFACVPLPDIDGSLETIAYAYDHLSTDGIILMANTQGVYLGDGILDPIMEELNRRSAVVLVHPMGLVGPPARGVIPSSVDFLLDTTRAAVSLVVNDIPRRFPNIRMILAHAGGFLPYAAYRIATRPNVADRAAMLDALSRFHFDLALSASPTVLPSLLPFAKPGHVLFGSDWPYSPDKMVGFFADNLDGYSGLDPAGHASVNRRSAEFLFPRLARQ